jgi:hypothetical protein
MKWLRSRGGKRFLVLLLGFSLAPVISAPAVHAMQPSRAPLYADWLRDQLTDGPSAEVEAAIQVAASTRAGSLGTFVKAFADAFSEMYPEAALTDVFPLEDSSTEALLFYLYGRYHHVLGGVPVATATLEAAPSSLKASIRTAAPLPDNQGTLQEPLSVTAFSAFEGEHLVFPVRLVSSARPLGP